MTVYLEGILGNLSTSPFYFIFSRFSDNRGDKLWPELNFLILFLNITPWAPCINVVFPQTANTSQASMYTSTLMLGEQGEIDFQFWPQYYRQDCS